MSVRQEGRWSYLLADKGLMLAAIFALLVAALFAASVVFRTSFEINGDVSWFLYVAEHIAAGQGTLYQDFIEPNAPLASHILLPAVVLRDALHVSAPTALILYVHALTALSLAATAVGLLRLGFTALATGCLTLILGCALLFLPGSHFAQREHLVVVLTLPYLLAAVARCSSIPVPAWQGAMTGVAAGLAFALKPHFILIYGAVELVKIFHVRRWRAVLLPETVTAAVVLVLSTGLTLIYYPAYFFDVLPWAIKVYGGYNQPGAFLRPSIFAATAIVPLGLVLLTRKCRVPVIGLRASLLAAIAASIAIYLVQGKGWTYQVIPAELYAAILIVILAISGHRSGGASFDIGLLNRCLALGLFVTLIAVWNVLMSPLVTVNGLRDSALFKEIRKRPGSYYALSTNVHVSFPLYHYVDRPWASRFPCLIMLPGLAAAEQSGNALAPDIQRLEQRFRAMVVEDLRTKRPDTIIMPDRQDQALPEDLYALNWFLRDNDFAAIWKQYRYVGTIDHMRVFARASQ